MEQASEKNTFALPGKLEKLRYASSVYFARKGHLLLQKIMVNAVHSVDVQYEYDGWDGGQSGHLVHLALPAELFYEALDSKDALEESLRTSFNKIEETPHEYICKVVLELLEGPELKGWREKSGVLLADAPQLDVSDQDINRLWHPGFLRVFLSHEAKHRAATSEIKDELVRYGVSCFVAHEDIEVTQTWQEEIETALQTMDVMVPLLTDGFKDSYWTNQEVGVAVGRRTPVISVMLGADPCGFIGKYQALAGRNVEMPDVAKSLIEIFLAHPKVRSKARDGLTKAFEESENYDRANHLINYLEKIEHASPELISRLENAPKNNAVVQKAYRVQKKLPPLLERLKNHGKDSTRGKS